MNRKTFQWIIIFMILMGMTSLACSAFGGNEETTEPPTEAPEAALPEEESPEETAPEPTAVPEPTDAPEPTAESAAAESESDDSQTSDSESDDEETSEPAASAAEAQAKTLNVSAITQPDELNSYRMIMDGETITTDEAGEEIIEAFVIDIAFSNDPEAMSLTMSIEGAEEAEEFGEIAMTQVDGVSYMVIPGVGCITTTEAESFGQDDPFAELGDASIFMEDFGDADFIGEEVINGIDTLHYAFDETSLIDETADVEWVEGHVYVAKEGGWLVRLSMEGEGVFDEIAEEPEFGTMRIQIDITDINQPLEFPIPADCEGEGAGGTEWPIMADAYEVSSFGGFLTYKTDLPLAEVLTFYREELAAAGWEESENESFTSEDASILTYYRGEESLNLSIVKEDDASDTLSVLIVSGE